jgi:DNA-binding CsgD family transcriptional regulator
MLESFCDRVAKCLTSDGIGQAFFEAVSREGFASSACRVVSGNTRTSRALFRHWPKDWASLSDAKSFGARSFVLQAACKQTAPFSWLDILQQQTLPAAEREVWDTAREFGWTNGFVVPIHGPHGYLAVASMGSRERDLDLGLERRAQLHMMAVLAHERCRALRHTLPTDVHDILGARELECLRWVAAGKTDWEIGVILNLSASTVRFHVDRARIKLDARTRPQAVAQVMLLGLL